MKQFKIIAALALAFCAFASFADRLANHRYVDNKLKQIDSYNEISYDKYGNPVTNRVEYAVFNVSKEGTDVVGLHVTKHPKLAENTGCITVDGNGAVIVANGKEERVYTDSGFDVLYSGKETKVTADSVTIGRSYKDAQSPKEGIHIPLLVESNDSHGGVVITEESGFDASNSSLSLRDVFAIGLNKYYIGTPKTVFDVYGTPYKLNDGTIEGNGEGVKIHHPTFVTPTHEKVGSRFVMTTNETTEVLRDYTRIKSGLYSERRDIYGNVSATGEARISSDGFKCGNRVNDRFDVEVRTNGFFVGGVDITTYITASDGTKFRAVNNGGSLSWEVVE